MTTLRLFAAGLMASTLLAAPAMAQSSPPAQPSKPPMAAEPAKPMANEPAKPSDASKPDAMKSPTAAQSTTSTPAAAAVKTAQQTGEWRASKLVGLNVYNDANEKIGDINELISGKDGKVQTVVIGVGGFLGMGEHRVGLAWEQVKFVDEAVKSSSTTSSTPATSRPATTGSAAPAATSTTASGPRDYPDHAVVSMTKEQLKALPAFKYNSDNKSPSR